MALTLIRPGEKLVFSTRWFDKEADQSDNPRPAEVAIEIVIHERRDERLEALAQRPTLVNFLKSEARSRVYA
ncbi:MAG: hypothetical protein DPW09_36205 [Anaerolineae bacterium]|nr:hypothetical protein [Anaerolineales bacterium]MCQ3978898.1 hypothetical protein [Anaerolineae bacterium]